MGKGDTRSRRGKIARGTHGKTRPRKKHPLKPSLLAKAHRSL